MYNDEVTFTKDALNNILMLYNNKGQTFINAAATAAYGLSGGGGNCYDLTTEGLIKLAFMGATAASTPANSTSIKFVVPGDGIINFAIGGNHTKYYLLQMLAYICAA